VDSSTFIDFYVSTAKPTAPFDPGSTIGHWSDSGVVHKTRWRNDYFLMVDIQNSSAAMTMMVGRDMVRTPEIWVKQNGLYPNWFCLPNNSRR
jgi:hypothetical protein